MYREEPAALSSGYTSKLSNVNRNVTNTEGGPISFRTPVIFIFILHGLLSYPDDGGNRFLRHVNSYVAGYKLLFAEDGRR
jgi:hypothetical protein